MAKRDKSQGKQKNSLNDNDQKGELTSLWEGEESLYNVEHEDYHINTQRLAASKRIVDVMSVEMTHVPGIGIGIIFLRPIMAEWSLSLNSGKKRLFIISARVVKCIFGTFIFYFLKFENDK